MSEFCAKKLKILRNLEIPCTIFVNSGQILRTFSADYSTLKLSVAFLAACIIADVDSSSSASATAPPSI